MKQPAASLFADVTLVVFTNDTIGETTMLMRHNRVRDRQPTPIYSPENAAKLHDAFGKARAPFETREITRRVGELAPHVDEAIDALVTADKTEPKSYAGAMGTAIAVLKAIKREADEAAALAEFQSNPSRKERQAEAMH